MTTKIDLNIRQWVLLILGILLAAYVAFQGRFLIMGPQIEFISPKDAQIVPSSTVELKGRAFNAAWITLNGKQIYTDKQGFWEETLLLSPGVSIMTVIVRDRFGREKAESIRIIFNG